MEGSVSMIPYPTCATKIFLKLAEQPLEKIPQRTKAHLLSIKRKNSTPRSIVIFFDSQKDLKQAFRKLQWFKNGQIPDYFVLPYFGSF